jgi:4-hydroxythreonine-4-phosphate dehydrogenase
MKPIAVSMGEPAGIGPEVILKAYAAREREKLPPFFVCGDLRLFAELGKPLGVEATLAEIADVERTFAEKLPVDGCGLHGSVDPGHPNRDHARAVIGAIDAAVSHTMEGDASAVVTAPIQKATLTAAGFKYPGHTEYLAAITAGPEAANVPEPVMLLVGGGMRVAPLTIHVPLKAVPGLITQTEIVRKGRILADGLRKDFGILRPRIAVAALNPHAGEAGTIGDEEATIIAPAIKLLAENGIDARGPYPADTLFHEAARARYDAVLAMYHDQALIPLKTVDFTTGVNVTLGLSIVRTSPDHGTALNIAGKGVADPSSFIAALKLAAKIAERREAAAAS